MDSSPTVQTYQPTELQRQMWLGQALFAGKPVYTLSVCIHLTGIDEERFRKAVQEVLEADPHLSLRVAGTLEKPLLEAGETGHTAFLDLRDAPSEAVSDLTEERRNLFVDPASQVFDSLLARLAGDEYRWFLSIHHIFADGWAVKVIVDRVLSRYASSSPSAQLGVQGYDAPIDPSAQLAECDRYLLSEDRAVDESYWKEKLSPPAKATDFYGLPYSPVPGARKTAVALGPELSQKIRAVAGRAGEARSNVAVANFFAASLFAYLYKLTGESHLSLGMPFSNRRTDEQRTSLGLRMQVGVLRIDVGEHDAFPTLLSAVGRESALANQHIRYTLGNSRNRLFDVMLNFHNVTYETIEGCTLTEEWLRSGNDTLPFTLHVRTSGEAGYLLEFDLQESLFGEGMRRRVIEDYLRVLRQVSTDPAVGLGTINLSGLPSPLRAPRPALPGARPPRREGLLHELFLTQARRRPGATAIIERNGSTTFGELAARSETIRDALLAAGCRPGSIVGLSMRRSTGSIAAMLGILEAGGVWLPLDPGYPSSRIAFMLADSGSKIVVTDREGARLIDRHLVPRPEMKPESIPVIVAVDARTGEPLAHRKRGRSARSGARPPASPGRLDDEQGATAAYCFYTSGSTGRPKGVIGSHEAALNRLRWMWREMPFDDDEVLLHKTSLSFIDSIWEVFGALLAGRATAVVPEETVRDPRALGALVDGLPIGRIIIVPSLLRALLDVPYGLPAGFEGISRWFITGEQLSGELAGRLMERLPAAEIYNLFGTTETYDAACHRLTAQDLSRPYVPIGRAIDNMELFVLDSALQPLPPGVRGELCIAGIGVAGGYLGRAELSSRRFLNVGTPPVRKLFRTGDAARLLPDGNCECLGRLDNMVKLRGYRVELEEIERLLLRLSGVAGALATVEEERLLAYVTVKPRTRLRQERIRRELCEELPRWMVPAIRIVDSLPSTPSGKRLRPHGGSRYPEEAGQQSGGTVGPAVARADGRNGDATHAVRRGTSKKGRELKKHERMLSTRNPLESLLAEIWKQHLGVDAVTATDNFFDLGGDSLLAVRVVAEIERRADIHLTLSALFESPTIRRLLVEQIRGSRRRGRLPVAIRLGSGRPLFAVPPAGSTVSAFGALARYLPAEQPFYSFQPEGIERGETPHRSIREMARDYILQMRTIQPEGPYLLAGRCFGGYVAYEMAQTLRAAGEVVAALIILDSPEAPLAAGEQPLHVGVRKLFHYYPARVRHFLGRRRFLYTLHMKARNEVAFLMGRLLDLLPVSLFESRERRLRALRHLHTLAYHRYAARPYPGPITIFWAAESPDLTGEREKWERLAAGGVEWHNLAAGHHDLMNEPNIKAVGALLSECLKRVQDGLARGAAI